MKRPSTSVRLTIGQKWANAYMKISKGENIYVPNDKFMCGQWTNNVLTIVLESTRMMSSNVRNEKNTELHAEARLR